MTGQLSGFRDKLNFRDLGGYESQDGRRIVKGRIYRSGGIHYMNASERARLGELGIRYILDLRTSSEVQLHPDPPLGDVEFRQHSGLVFRGGEEIDFSPAGMHQIGRGGQEQLKKLRVYYTEMPFDNEAFRILLDMLEQQQTPLIFHCASGKDRTGVAAMVILLALGVARSQILDDYLLSNEYRRDAISKAHATHAQVIEGDAAAKQLIQMEAGVTQDIGEAVLAEIERRYPHPEAYLESEFGLNAERLERLRNLYLEA